MNFPMPTLRVTAHGLALEDVPLTTIAATYGTPCYVYSRTAIEEAFERYRTALPPERAEIDALMAALRTQLQGNDPAAIEAATSALAKGTEAFAARRMNRSIQQALAGKSVQSL